MGANIVAIEKDTQVLDGFGISNEDGYFKLILKSDTDYDLKISFIGFKYNSTIDVGLKSLSSTPNIRLSISSE